MIEPEVLQRVLGTALRTGGDFAEVFVEDRRSSSGRFDDARVEELVSGRDRGAGLRVVRGDTTGFAHTADLSRAGLLHAAEAAAGAARGGGGGVHTVALGAPSAHPIDGSVVLPQFLPPGSFNLYVSRPGGKPYIFQKVGTVTLPVHGRTVIAYRDQ